MEELTEAIQLRESGKLHEAKEKLLQLTQREPANAQVFYQCAWVHDAMGLEREAVPYYEQAIALGLPEADKQGALLGLGSTYRTLGQYEQAEALFLAAMAEFPEQRELNVFYAMTLHNLGRHEEALGLALRLLADTSADPGIQSYRRAILFYSDKLNQIWE